MMLCSPQPSCDLNSDFTVDASAITAPATAATAASAAAPAVAVLPAAADLFYSPEPSCDMASDGADAARPAAAAATPAAAVRPAVMLRVEKRKEANRQNQRRMRQKRQEETDIAIQSVSAADLKLQQTNLSAIYARCRNGSEMVARAAQHTTRCAAL
jgi:hypothetical protein